MVGAAENSDDIWFSIRSIADMRLSVWRRHVGDPFLRSNTTHRIDSTLCMVAALEDEDPLQKAPAIVGCRAPSALAAACERC